MAQHADRFIWYILAVGDPCWGFTLLPPFLLASHILGVGGQGMEGILAVKCKASRGQDGKRARPAPRHFDVATTRLLSPSCIIEEESEAPPRVSLLKNTRGEVLHFETGERGGEENRL